MKGNEPVPRMMNDRALRALKEAVRNVYWTREEFRKLFIRCDLPQSLVQEVRQDEKTWSIVDVVLERLNNDPRFHHLIERLLTEVLTYRDGKHLNWAGKERVLAAEESLKSLRLEVGELAEERRKKRDEQERRSRALDQAHRGKIFREKLTALKRQFLDWFSAADRQARGLDFEGFLTDLFDLFDLASKGSFVRGAEQIDGAFRLGEDNYLIEAKWQRESVNLSQLRDLDGAVSTSIETTLGLFISVNGFSEGAVRDLTTGNRPRVICMDGSDIISVLEEQIALTDLIRRKKELAAQRRRIFVTAAEILSGSL